MGVPNDIVRQPRADVQLGPDHWFTQADWPAPTRTTTLRPRQDGALDRIPSTGTGSYLDTLQTEVAMAVDPGTTNPYRLAFLTPTLTNAMRLSGTPSVSLRVTLDKPTANLGVMLVDYGQDTRIHGADPVGQGLSSSTARTASARARPTTPAATAGPPTTRLPPASKWSPAESSTRRTTPR
jgi:X-Pro dipeptidyl-peptidase